MIAYYGGAGPNPDNGISGHVTFFVQDETTINGTYNYNKSEEGPRDPVKTNATAVDPITGLPIEACTGNDVGLCDDSLKDAGRCGGAAKHVKDRVVPSVDPFSPPLIPLILPLLPLVLSLP